MPRRVITNIAVAPYYDDYDSSKQYTQLLAIPGRVAQAREITQIQSTIKDIIKSIGDSILKDGDIIEGCQVIVNSDKNKVTVTSGKIYIGGMVLPVKETEVAISGEGTETIGAKLVEYLITEQEDNTLRDPAQGYDNYNQAGCHRIQSEIEIVANDPSSAILFTLTDGDVYLESYAPEYDTLTQTLARRTYDESGSYVVDGLKVRTEEISESDKYNVVIEAGKAYILGYELKIPNARRIKANKSLTYSTVESSRTYSTSNDTYTLYSNHPFIRNIIEVTGAKEYSENLSNSSNGNRLTQTDVQPTQEHITITQDITTYTFGTDYTIEQQGGSYYVVWSSSGSQPASGTSYNITYRYNKKFSSTTDFSLEITSEGHSIKWTSGGDHPENNTIFTVRFNQYLARKDLVYIDRYGKTSIVEGTPAEYTREVAPEAPLNTLTLAIINNPPNGSVVATESSEEITADNIGLTRFTMRDIQNLVNRVKTIEYDQAVLSLNDEARNDAATNKKGIFTDPLIDLSRVDFYFDKNSRIYDMAIDLVNNIAYLPIDTHTYNPTYDATNSTTHRYDRLTTLSTEGEEVSLSQDRATKLFKINPYSVFPQLPVVTLDPAVDNNIYEREITIPVSSTTSEVVKTTSRRVETTSWRNFNDSSNTTTHSDTAIGIRTEPSTSSRSILSESFSIYIKPREITVEGHNFYPNLNNIKATFDSVPVSLTPLGDTEAGIASGSVKADANGYLKAKFTIPDNILSGTREVILRSDDVVVDGYSNEGFAFYIAQSIDRVIQNTVTTVTTVLLERVITTTTNHMIQRVDPVGQTFVLDRMTLIKGIDIYFGEKPGDGINIPVVCEIRGVSNGTITSQIYAQSTLYPADIIVSQNSSNATRFNFSDPALLEENKEYALVLRSTSDAYTIWVAEMGGTDVLTKELVLKNAYMTGVMLSSSNNSTWTAHQTTDIKFRLISDIYSDSSVVVFNDVTASEFSRIYLTADSAIPDDTSISWSYKLDGETDYKSITPYNIVTMNQLKTNISLKAELSRGINNRLSPLLALDTISLNTSCYDNTSTNGYYISRNITGLSNYTKVKIVMDVHEPSASTSIIAKISTDDGNTLIDATRETNTVALSYGWKECTYNATVPASTSCRIFIQANSATKYETPAFRRLRVIFSA